MSIETRNWLLTLLVGAVWGVLLTLWWTQPWWR